MPAANPLPLYNTGYTSGMNSGTTQQAAQSFSSSAYSGGQDVVGGNTNIVTAALVGGSLFVLLVLHLLGFRFAFDVSVGKR